MQLWPVRRRGRRVENDLGVLRLSAFAGDRFFFDKHKCVRCEQPGQEIMS